MISDFTAALPKRNAERWSLLVLEYESGRWGPLAESCRRSGLHEIFLPDLYLRSVRWVSEVLAEVPVTA